MSYVLINGSRAASSSIVNVNRITASIASLGFVQNVTVVNIYDQSFNLPVTQFYPRALPVVNSATIINESQRRIELNGNNFLNVKEIQTINSVGTVIETLLKTNNGFDICGNSLMQFTFLASTRNIQSVRVKDNYDVVVEKMFSSALILSTVICFPAGTPINCDQGVIDIDKINSDLHTIRGKKIVAITKTISPDKNIVCIEKDAFGKNIPSKQTMISKDHKILYNGKMCKAKEFVGEIYGVKYVKYNKEVLYNVLLEEHGKMVVNNLICETLHPDNGVAKLYRVLPTLTPEEQEELITELNNRLAQKRNSDKKQR
jgi:hypothetical protein